jgi:hypothetical protein
MLERVNDFAAISNGMETIFHGKVWRNGSSTKMDYIIPKGYSHSCSIDYLNEFYIPSRAEK